ncbi:type IV toxin-antitoxin system AbiEi family antitoxin domain-containing protein [Leifsonia shinshuensis]|uniref:Very-short-patch-repair endonuclease n=1 Tax=Leifsonia shinshuensis TaxID=150026 RepID=A0A853CWB5_9MICO|nr:type IV toxin-antitoxin system AbiEi family antitoxin domain-containing protein [Leifsonia shinshuensis]NYJ24748.1 very-short-patch-repair endonuclease [Leifsonia shinshuensis]
MTWMNRLRELGGAATTHQLRMAGATAEDLKRAVRSGAVDRVRRGVYISPLLDGAGLDAVRAGARLSCVSACASYGLWAGSGRRTHVTLSPQSRRAPPGLVCHWWPVEAHPELWRVSLADCLRSVARCGDEETAVAAFDTALAAGHVSPSGLRRILEGTPKAARDRAALARPGSDSGVESVVRQRLERHGRRVEQQVHVRGVGRVDMRIDGELYLEIDGYAFHGDARAFERDRLRDAALAELGHRRLRVSARQVVEDWQRVETAIDRIVERQRPQ